ncbi:LysM peptidoglycan-binding domain-containing protein [Cognatiyoonia sp. IB215446]|uniref:LysM peptidoglycan-binding domain-containing protein n=1 Tax=Cognatiyoonia sp. IB215446 TaxID=3097355 RepID=UPI002A0FE546|nr:LysM peptidoglycan-binding domain-containing protein [Cognatiyoonia sp. IB215446]MDX8349694.1 LysM peptidoglycan-binding domain-containing protein [Cognatiyoonia sp. IB215446]
MRLKHLERTAEEVSSVLVTGSASFALAFTALAFAPKPASAQELCSTYTVVRGDTLSGIAGAADVPGGFQFLFNANTDVLANPNLLEVGQVIKIPCADGSLPGAAASVVRPATPLAAAQPTELSRPIRIATATGYAPFTDEGLPGGGMITQMVDRSMQLGNPDQEYTLVFINDWGSHLETLLPSGAIDMVFPWFRPNCDRVENLSPASAYRCTDFNHSEPFYELFVDFYTLNGSAYAAADSYDDLIGARICRPEAWFTFDLEAEGLTPPNVEYITTVEQNGCWPLLVTGEVDIVTYDALPAEEDARNAGLTDQITTLEALRGTVTSHVFVSKNNPIANEALPILNAGLEELRLSGEWFSIVRESIRETVEN